mmetsp:Transcript_18015/g.44729  ORF Transcript_18015/g.44729 Transcript_18015/m.44729 type:complete len:312 (-) Transcript_18015:430-1365(-)
MLVAFEMSIITSVVPCTGWTFFTAAISTAMERAEVYSDRSSIGMLPSFRLSAILNLLLATTSLLFFTASSTACTSFSILVINISLPPPLILLIFTLVSCRMVSTLLVSSASVCFASASAAMRALIGTAATARSWRITSNAAKNWVGITLLLPTATSSFKVERTCLCRAGEMPTCPPSVERERRRLRRLRSIAKKGSFLLRRRSSHVSARLPVSDILVSHVSGTGRRIRCPAFSSSNMPGSPLFLKSSTVEGYFFPSRDITCRGGELTWHIRSMFLIECMLSALMASSAAPADTSLRRFRSSFRLLSYLASW